MASYELTQISEAIGTCPDDVDYPVHRSTSMSDDGSLVVFTAQTEPGRPLRAIWLYDRNLGEARQLSVNVGGESRLLIAEKPKISGDGRKIVFAAKGYYTAERKSGIYIYDVASETVRLIKDDKIPRYDNGAAIPGSPGRRKYVNSMPCISRDGQRLAYLLSDYEYNGATSDHWQNTSQRLMAAEISGDRVRGGDIVSINRENTFGNGIQSISISGNGRLIAFYAGGVVEGLDVLNLEMPPYTEVSHDEHSSPTCNVYCYLASENFPGQFALRVVPDPRQPTSPLVVAHPYASSIQGFGIANLLSTGPSINGNGSRVALHGNFVMRSETTGVYLCESMGFPETFQPIIYYGARPGAGPGDVELTTGALPALSPDGRWLAYYQCTFSFPEGYGDPSSYAPGETHCPRVIREGYIAQRLPHGETVPIIETVWEEEECVAHTSSGSMALASNAAYSAFISRDDKVGMNPDRSHEVYFATQVP